MFSDPGLPEDEARTPTLPESLETEPGSFKLLDECTEEEIGIKILSLTMHAQALADQASALRAYLGSGR